MKVKELVELLLKMPQDLTVVCNSALPDGYDEITGAETIKVKIYHARHHGKYEQAFNSNAKDVVYLEG